jgi:hypothetical protein
MKRIRNFVKHTFKDVPKEERQGIIDQVTLTLVEKVEDLQENGYTLDDAINKTVIEFGDASDYFNHSEKPLRLIDRIKTIRHYRNDVVFSAFGALIIIGMLAFTNLYYTGSIIWFVLPALAVLWWPLAVVYRYLNKKEGEHNDE